ncbi:MAG: UDP-glucose/GDP-mannose dehydrogenase family protein [Bacteroidetes bacterium]|nr:UDP-glucose/GDP-mannose dehydrogenase family protein [Bacteroidota bacterium]
MNIAVIGTGYVGLVTGTCFAESGNNVICVDNNKDKVEKLKQGIIPIYEPELDALLERNAKQNRVQFTTDLEDAVKKSSIILLALPTPPGEDGSADLSYILGVAEQLGKIITEYKVIVHKSTVPVGTAEKVSAVIKKNSSVDFDVVSNPEFLREGFAVNDFMKPDRVVIGVRNERARKVMEELYKPFVRQGNPIYFMDERSAELTKYAANAFLAVKISFMNEIANLCELVGADVDQIRIGIGSDTRIGKRFLFPGIGYGGSCFPKDVKALIKSSKDVNYNFKILNAVEEVNSTQKTIIVPKIEDYFEGDLKGKTFGIWGLAFKPNTDDIREAPAMYVIEELLKKGAKIKAFDPEGMENMKVVFGNKIEFCDNQYDAISGADALVIATEWSVFRAPDFEKMKELLKTPVIFDGRNLFDLESIQAKGFDYISIGRTQVVNKKALAK